MNKSFVIGLALTSLLGVAGFDWCETTVNAQQGQRPQGPPPQGEMPRRGGDPGSERMVLALLDLSSEQKEQIEKIRESERAAAKSIHEQLKTVHEQLQAATKDGAFNESAVRSLLAQAQQPELEIEVLHIKMHSAIFNVLTAAQKAKFIELQEKMEKHHDGPPPPRN